MGAPLIIVGDELKNRSFETASPWDWLSLGAGQFIPDRSGSPAAVDGDATGQLTGDSGAGFYQEVTPAIVTLSGEAWTWGIYGRSASGDKSAQARIRYYDKDGTLQGTDTATTTITDSAWTWVEVDGSVPADNTITLRADITKTTGGSDTTHWDLGFFGRRVDFENPWRRFHAPEGSARTTSISEGGRLEVRWLYQTTELEIATYPEANVDTQVSGWWKLVAQGQTFHALTDRADTAADRFVDFYSLDSRLRRVRLAGGNWEYTIGGWKAEAS